MGNFTWNGDAFLDAIEREYSARLDAAAQVLADKTRELLSVQGPPRSKPGEPSHKDSGDMYDSITVRGSGLVRQVGSPLDYYVYQNLGIGRQAKDVTKTKHYNKPSQIEGFAPRPSAVPALTAAAPQISRILVDGHATANT